jgi:acetyl esterase/lipase
VASSAHPAERTDEPVPAIWMLARLVFRMVLRLPAPLLLWIAGGTPAGRGDGIPVDPRARFHAWFVTRFRRPSSPDPAAARRPRLVSLFLLDGPAVPMRGCRDLTFPGPAGPLRARLYTPSGCPTPSAALIYLHFGGCVIGDLSSCHTACTILADHAGCQVLSVDYRLAPEHRYPAALLDTIAALRWLRAEAGRFGIDPGRIGIGGDSAGGYLAAAACLHAVTAGESLPKVQLLIYPVLEMDRSRVPPTPHDDCYPLTRADMDWFAGLYMNHPDDAADPLCSVGRARTLAGMPPTILVQAGHDLLFDEGARFADRLAAEGVPLTRLVYPTLPHAFTAMSGALPAARAALVEIAGTLGEALHRPGQTAEHTTPPEIP